MQPTSRRTPWKSLTAIVYLFVFFLVLGAPALAEEPAKLSPLEKEMDMVGKLIHNAQMKLRRGVVGIAPADKAKDSIITPGNACCGENIERINKGLDKIRAMVRDRGTCFEQKWDRGGTEAVTLTTQDLRALAAGTQAFGEALEPADTHGALAGTQRAYVNLKRRIDALPPCSPGAIAPKK